MDDVPGEWIVTEFNGNRSKTVSFKTSESYSKTHLKGKNLFDGNIINNDDFRIDSVILNHIIPSAGYRISEHESYNVQKKKLIKLKFLPGPWLEKVKDFSFDGRTKIELNKKKYSLNFLRKELLTVKKGESIAYLTDFVYDRQSVSRAVKLIKNCDTVFCESQYSSCDIKLAKRNYHLTVKQTAKLAEKAKVKKLILFHISDRYRVKEDYSLILKEARQIFPNTFFPEDWLA